MAREFVSRGGFKAKVVQEGVTSRDRKIKQQEATRQTRENTMRIVQFENARQLIKLIDFKRIDFAYNPVPIFNISVF